MDEPVVTISDTTPVNASAATFFTADLTSNITECLASLERMFGFLADISDRYTTDSGLLTRIRTLSHDCRSLMQYADSLTNKIGFLLEADALRAEQGDFAGIHELLDVMRRSDWARCSMLSCSS